MRAFRGAVNIVWVACGWIAFALGIVGIFLPLLPTTPFILLAAFCFSKGSPRLHQWLRTSKIAGQIVRDWEEHGMIRLRAKVLATVLMIAMISYPCFFMGLPWTYSAAMGLTTICVLTFIWTRPSGPRQP